MKHFLSFNHFKDLETGNRWSKIWRVGWMFYALQIIYVLTSPVSVCTLSYKKTKQKKTYFRSFFPCFSFNTSFHWYRKFRIVFCSNCLVTLKINTHQNAVLFPKTVAMTFPVDFEALNFFYCRELECCQYINSDLVFRS